MQLKKKELMMKYISLIQDDNAWTNMDYAF